MDHTGPGILTNYGVNWQTQNMFLPNCNKLSITFFQIYVLIKIEILK